MVELGYSFSLTAFRPPAKPVWIECALVAIAGGVSSVGIRAANGVLLATEKKTEIHSL